MANCKHTINIDGVRKEFYSDRELHEFLRTHKKGLVTALLTDKVMFSTDKSKQDTIDDLLTTRDSKVIFNKVLHTFTIDNVSYEPVTKFIVNNNFVRGFNMGDWEAKEVESLQKQVGTDGKPQYQPEQIQKIITDRKRAWETQSLVGTSWHDIAEGFFNGSITTGDDIAKRFPELTSRDYILRKYISSLSNIKEALQRKHGDDAIFRPEVKLWDKEGIAGMADLIVIDRNGVTHIYDYKTSAKDEVVWNEVKLSTIEYQLGMYKQLLRRNGIEVGSMSYIPITLKDIDYNTKIINEFDPQAPKGVYLPENEKVMRKINRVLPFDYSIKLGDVTSNKAVYQFLKTAFNYERPADKVIKPEAIADEMIKLKQTTSNDGRSYVIYNPFNLEDNTYIDKNATDAMIQRTLEKELKYQSDYQRILPIRFYDFVSYAKNQVEKSQPINWESRWGKDSGTVNKMMTLLTKYIMDPAWRPLQSDALYDLNTVGFENSETDQIDLITLTGDNLDKMPSLLADGGKAKSLLGNFMPDSKALMNRIPAVVTNGDVELLKLMAFVKANKDIFGDRQIGQLYAVNVIRGKIVPKVYTQTIDGLTRQWDALMEHIPVQLDLKAKDWTVKSMDFVDAFVQDIQNMFNRQEFNPTNFRWIKKSLDGLIGATEKTEKITFLDRIATQLSKDIGYNTATGVFRQPDSSRLIYLASQAILQLEDLPTIREHDMKKFANLLKENINFSNPTSIQNQAYSNVVKLVSKALNNTTHKFNEYKVRVREMTAELYEAQGSKLAVKIIGNNLSIFKNMLETENGKPGGKLTMRLKDPNSPDLQPAEAKYIRGYTALLKEVRLEKLKALGETGFLDPDDERNIPLMRASELTSFIGQNYKAWFQNFFRNVTNPNNIFENDKESWEILAKQSKMFNFFDNFDMNPENRLEELAHNDPSRYETDLEAVMDMYFMIHSKEVEMNKVMPAINAQKMFTMFSEHYMFENNETTARGINDYIATVIFDKNLLAEESKGLAITAQAIKRITGAAVMTANITSGITHAALGFMNNNTRLLANRFDKTAFQTGDLAKANALVYGDLKTNKMSYESVSFCDNLNEMYRLSDMTLKELVHKVQTTSKGIVNFGSQWAFWLQSTPIYINRMAMFNAQMIHDGILKVSASGKIEKNSALQMVDGQLVYNERLDDRFKTYLDKPEQPIHLQSDAWKESRAAYLKSKELLSQEPGGLKSDGSLARPYDNLTRDSLKTGADDVHGNYDKETRTRMEQLAFGKLFFQFKTYITAKKNRWYMETHPDDRRGQWVTEWHEGQPVKLWQGKVTEGIYQTLCALGSEIHGNKGNLIKSWDTLHSSQKQNVALMLGDIAQFGIFALMLGLIGYSAIKKTDPVQAEMLRGLSNASSDLWIGTTISSLAGEKNPMAVLSWGTGVLGNTWGVFTGTPHAGYNLLNHVAAFRLVNAATK